VNISTSVTGIYFIVNTGMAGGLNCVMVECYGKLGVVRRHVHLPCWMELGGKHWCGKQAFLDFLLELHSKLQGMMEKWHVFVSVRL
jgi:hypothetical protein